MHNGPLYSCVVSYVVDGVPDCRGLVRDNGFAAEDAVLVGKREANDFEPAFLDQFLCGGRSLELLIAP